MNAEAKQSVVSIVSVRELMDNRYNIPPYQRGYRWTTNEVVALLRDIDEFASKCHEDSNRWYPLQPLVVVATESEGEDRIYSVIDGQQRLTTLMLITAYLRKNLNERLVAKLRIQNFDNRLTYHSRPETTRMVDAFFLDGESDAVLGAEGEIDRHHLSEAWSAISAWFRSKDDFLQDPKCEMFLNCLFDRTGVIWYEPSCSATDSCQADRNESVNPVRIFTRINSGKVPLTDGELIKAIFLKNESAMDSTKASQREPLERIQLEIAMEWDQIERALGDDSLWYFLAGCREAPETRIDLIFETHSQVKVKNRSRSGYALFHAYQNYLDETVDAGRRQLWYSVSECFLTLQSWFKNHESFHKIGFLTATKCNLADVYREYRRSSSKSGFWNDINDRMRKQIPTNLESLNFGDPGVRNTLLLHNIATLGNIAKRRSIEGFSEEVLPGRRFPFHRYHAESWDVEHIHPQKERIPESRKHRIGWLRDTNGYLTKLNESIDDFWREPTADLKKMLKRIESFQDFNDDQKFQDIYSSAIEFLEHQWSNLKTCTLGNLTLLDSGTNRSYGNAIFPVKRAAIIEREKAGIFVPVCTRNAFLKYYSRDTDDLSLWEGEDADAYLCDIQEQIRAFLPEGSEDFQ